MGKEGKAKRKREIRRKRRGEEGGGKEGVGDVLYETIFCLATFFSFFFS